MKIRGQGEHRLARNFAWNSVGQVAPILAALVAIPLLVRSLGSARFGVLSLMWLVVGYASFLDAGLGRAVTMLVARRRGQADEEEVGPQIRTALMIMFLVGAIAGLLAWVGAPLFVRLVLRGSVARADALRAVWIVAFSLPFVATSTGFRGILEAFHEFGLSNAVRAPFAVATVVGPLAVLPLGRSLTALAAVLLLTRLVSWLAFAILALRVMPALRRGRALKLGSTLTLLRMGGWISVSNIVAPLMVYLDRFAVGAMLSVAAVAYYATPYEVVTRLLVIPLALAGVLFPAFAAASDPARGWDLLARGSRYAFVSLFPVSLVLVAFAPEILGIWLGPDFARHSARVLQLLTVGVVFNAVAQISFALVQGTGRPDLTGKLHLVEAPIYSIVLIWSIRVAGLQGAAASWAARAAVDMIVLLVFAWRQTGRPRVFSARLVKLIAGAAGALVLVGLPWPLTVRAAAAVALVAGFTWVLWRQILSPSERSFALSRVRR